MQAKGRIGTTVQRVKTPASHTWREDIMREVMEVVMENAERHALRRLGVPDEEEYELAQRALELEESELRDEEVILQEKTVKRRIF